MVEPTPITDAGLVELEPVSWRWHWLAGDEPDVWAYTETAISSDAHRYAEPLYGPSIVHRLRTTEAELAMARAIMTAPGLSSIPDDWTLPRIAEARAHDWLAMRDQARDACARAEKAEAEVARLVAERQVTAAKCLNAHGPFYERAKAWWATNMKNSGDVVGASVTGDGYIRFMWADQDERGEYDVQIARLYGLHSESSASRPAPAQPGQSSAQPAAVAWQPIETAPKGGEWFLGYWPECQFSPDRITPTTYCYSCTDGPRFLDADDHRFGQPTHWMDLPSPPADPAQGRQGDSDHG